MTRAFDFPGPRPDRYCRALCLVFMVLLALAGVCAWAAYPISVKDSRGKVVTIKARPERLVSLTPGTTEILFALGLGSRVVGDTGYCNFPPAAAGKRKVGDSTISVEAVLGLKPDLVLAHGKLNETVVAQLERLGLTVFTMDPKTVSEVARDIRSVGLITGRPKTARAVAARLEQSVFRAKAACAKRGRKRVLFVVQSDPLWAAGPNTFVDEMIRDVNARNVAGDARAGYVTFSKELAVSRNPDLILVGREADVGYFYRSAAWRNTNAARHKRVLAVNSDIFFRPGPRLADGLMKLAQEMGR